ncbi:DegT/DnrJ/EryC1/StrS family aminotransferase [Rhizosaccharibacter radicis]|uniref:DegT/DnrJ/EryC1/StrS family aminotransferase n=1 Tax=Rhizosaccharibacter radicis TaxID=2782605 RepID=A0ABT1W0K9_9PROT|nr:DegT/DnrJ/EryC1/StrS family aminotransferase [Acetobacteraceae bacterium KSS12]
MSAMAEALARIEDSGTFTNYGPMNTRFERALEDRMFGTPDTVVTTCNATIALLLTIKDAVVTRGRQRARYALMPAFTFAAAAQAAEWVRLTPLLCDIDPADWAACARSEERLIARHHADIAVIVPYATFGNCVDLDRYDWISRRYDIPVVIDAAASLGSLDGEGKAFGKGCRHPVIFSMHATKAFSVGEGGVVYCEDRATIRRLRDMGNFGFGAPRTATMPGLNSKLTEMAATVALAQLDRHEGVINRREEIAARYRAGLPGWTFQRRNGIRQANSLMPVVPPDQYRGTRSELIAALAADGIGAMAYFSPHLGEHPHLVGRVVSDTLPVTDSLSKRVLGLPNWEEMTDAMVDDVCDALHRICGTDTAAVRPSLSRMDQIARQERSIAVVLAPGRNGVPAAEPLAAQPLSPPPPAVAGREGMPGVAP